MIEGIEDQDQDQDQERRMLRLKSWKDREGYICEYFSHLLAANPVHNIHSRRRSDPRQWRESVKGTCAIHWEQSADYKIYTTRWMNFPSHPYAFGKWPETHTDFMLCLSLQTGDLYKFLYSRIPTELSASRHNALNTERVHTSTIVMVPTQLDPAPLNVSFLSQHERIPTSSVSNFSQKYKNQGYSMGEDNICWLL